MTPTLTRSNLIARAVMLAAAAVVVVAVILIAQGGSSYTLRMQMTNANGLRPGSQVLLGGVGVGTVSSVDVGPHDSVIAKLSLDPNKVHIGQGVSASIIAANLLGELYVALKPGNPNAPLPSGTLLPPSRLTVPTDLDQIVNVFDAPTRQRFGILINEMGIAVAGRRNDVSAILRQLPLSAEAANSLLTQMVQDNHTLRDLVANSNQFISRINVQKADLGNVINAASGAATTAALQANNLSQTLIKAPQSLNVLKAFVFKLGQTTADMTPAAAQIRDSAVPLDTLLAQVHPFQRAAVPTLNQAASVSPLLSRLGDQATPTITQALPTVNALAHIATIANPLTYWLGSSVADVLGLMNGWTRAIQFRDGLGHVFHAELGISPSVIVNLAKLGLTSHKSSAKTAARSGAQPTGGTVAPSSSPSSAAPASPAPAPAPAAPNPVSGLLQKLTGLLGGGSGGSGGGSSGSTAGSGGSGGSGGSTASNLNSLLGYLLGK
jgi:virulence factor Mce-like protein